MTKNGFIPKGDMERGIWIKNFAGKLAIYATLLGITAAEVAAIVADSAAYNYMLDLVEWFKRESNKRVNYKDTLADGDIGTVLGPIPSVGTAPEAPTAVPAGVFKRVSKIAQRIKNHPSYTVSIGKDLGIEPNETTVDMASVKPELTVQLNADKPVIWWKKGNMVAADIYVDRNDGKGFQFLVTATASRYTDTHELPAGVNSATWQYKAIYKNGNAQTGAFSDVVYITVFRSVAAV